MNLSRWFRDSRLRRRVTLGFYAALLLAVAGEIVHIVATVIASRTAALPNRLAETGDWLAGGTLALAVIAGLVALQAYASATGLPRLQLSVRFVRRSVDGNDSEPTPIASSEKSLGPVTVMFEVRNASSYSARNPAIAITLQGPHFASQAPTLGEGWAITYGDHEQILEIQWDGGPVYSIHGHSVRRLQFTVDIIDYGSKPSPMVVELLAEGYRRGPIDVDVPSPSSLALKDGAKLVMVGTLGWQ